MWLKYSSRGGEGRGGEGGQTCHAFGIIAIIELMQGFNDKYDKPEKKDNHTHRLAWGWKWGGGWGAGGGCKNEDVNGKSVANQIPISYIP